jgi:cysteine-rich repeat protein
MSRARCVSLVVALTAVLAAAGQVRADTEVPGGDIVDEVWNAAGSPYRVRGDITVPGGAFLRIEAGAEVVFDGADPDGGGADAARIELVVAGAFEIEGTADRPVVLRAASPARAAWAGIAIASSTQARLRFATVSDAAIGVRIDGTGAAELDHAVLIGNSTGVHWQAPASGLTSRIVRSTIYGDGTGAGIRVTDLPAGAVVDVVDSIITGNAVGVVRTGANSTGVRVGHSDVWGNTSNATGLVLQATSFSANPLFVSDRDLRLTSASPARLAASDRGDIGARPYDGVPTVGLLGTLRTDMTMTRAGSPYVLDGDLTVAPGVTLAIEPGVIVLGGPDGMRAGSSIARSEIIVDGRLIAIATPDAPIVLTAPEGGRWYGVVVRSPGVALLDGVQESRGEVGLTYASNLGGSVIRRSSFDDNSDTGVYLRAGSPVLQSVRAARNAMRGVRSGPSTRPTLVNCVLTDNHVGVHYQGANVDRLVLDSCTLRNGLYAVVSQTSGNNATLEVRNSIITGATNGVRAVDRATVLVQYSNVWGNQIDFFSVIPGIGTISVDPRLVSATDARLLPGSPSIDAVMSGPVDDVTGAARPVDGDGDGAARWDMGAHEHVAPVCGDGVIEPGEACDDGNVGAGDGCGPDCAIEVADAGVPDAAIDAAVDAGIDAPVDAGIDAPVDASVDATVDAGVPDAGVDAPADAAIDAPVDAAVDAPVDAGIDAAVDAGIDAAAPMIDAAPTVDAAPSPDAAPPPIDEDGGCGCGAGGGGAPWTALAAALALVIRSRRAR